MSYLSAILSISSHGKTVALREQRKIKQPQTHKTWPYLALVSPFSLYFLLSLSTGVSWPTKPVAELCSVLFWEREEQAIFGLQKEQAISTWNYNTGQVWPDVGNVAHKTEENGLCIKSFSWKGCLLVWTFARLYTWPFTVLSFFLRC